jgi:hypothetical protein
MPTHWEPIITLPNLAVPEPTPFETSGFAICAGDDARFTEHPADRAIATMGRIIRQFRTARRERYVPGCFAFRSDIPRARRNAEAIRAFRNVCALACTTSADAVGLASRYGPRWTVHWSDQFLFGYFTAGKSGWVHTLDGAMRGMDDKIPWSQPSPQFGNPHHWSLLPDTSLLARLLDCWRRYYLRRRQRRILRRLFRSLEIAFHASMFPADGLTSINDYGTRLAQWVSAFEVLCHPGGGLSVGKRDVQGVLRVVPFNVRALKMNRYRISHKGKTFPASLPESLYDSLYLARNQFLHGMPVSFCTLRYHRSKQYALLSQIAPVLYNAALVKSQD